MQTPILAILRIAASFTVLFILPFILVASKVFRDEDRVFQVCMGMIIGLFSSMALVYSLAVFGAFNKVNFLILYAAIILVCNLYFLRKTRLRKISFKLGLTPSFVLLLFAFGIGSYMRLYDPLRHASLGSGDFYQHLQFLKETAGGRIFASYPRGYHIILTLIHYVSNLDSYAVARFAGPVFGIVSIGAVYCLMKHVFGRKAAIFSTLFYSGLSIFNYLTIEEMGLFAQGFGFVLIPFIVCFALDLVKNFGEGSIRRRNILLFIFLVFLLSLISPYTMLQTSYILYPLLLFGIAFHPGIRKRIGQFLKNAAILTIVFSLGILIVFSYYTLLREFRNVGLAVTTYDRSKVERLVKAGTSRPEAMKESTVFVDWTDRKWEIVKGLVQIKRFQVPVKFPLSVGVYLGLSLSIFLLAISLRKRSLEFFAIGFFIFLFGISCITGILELPLYQGRSGWYFMLGSIWLGGIMVKRFYDQTLTRDILHPLKRVIPSAIMNKAMNMGKSKGSLIYLILTLSVLIGYLAIIWALGLLGLSPIREASVLLLIPIMIVMAGRNRRDVLSVETAPYGSPQSTRTSLSLHKTLVLTVVLVVMLYPLPKPPEYNFRYYHRNTNEDDFVKVVQQIEHGYPLRKVRIVFDNNIVRRAARKTKNMVYPQNVEIVETQDILSATGNKRYNFLFSGAAMEKSEFLEKTKEWVSKSKQHNDVRVFFNSDNIVVYLIEK